MQKIRIPKETWLKSWRALLQEGAITQVSEDCYIVSARHVQILTEKQLPFEEVKGEQTFHRGRGMQIERRRLMQCPNCQHENREGAKFCEGCGTKLPQTCPNCGTEVRPQARFCDACGTQLTGAAASPTQVHVPKLEDLHAQLQSLIPDALAQKYLSAEREITGENRLITVLFADISGSTALSRTRSPEAMFQLMQDCFKDLVNIVAGYEGSISGFRGDGLLALYGAPILHENDPERAILAAIDMRDAMRKRGLEITVGINTALMTVGEIQTALHKEYTAYGTEINLAARLQQAAKGGQIFVGSGTYRQTRYAFDFGRIENLTLKGLGGGIVAYEVLGVKVHPEKVRGIEGLRARMIGREREFAELKEAADGWLAGSGQVVSIIGEAGIGKSRLVSELKTYLTSPPAPLLQGEGSKESPPSLAEPAPIYRGKGAGGLGQKPTVLEGRCVSIGQPISYWPFLDILRTYFGLREADTEAEIARKVTDGVRGLFQTSEVSKTSEVYAEEFLPFIGRLMSIRFGNELDKRLDFATPDQIKHQTIMRLKDLFETLASRGRGIPSSIESRGKDSAPTMLILEDLHWADDLSLDLISLLMDSLATTPLMLLCVYRPEQEHRVWQLSSLAGRKCLDRYTEITLKQLSSHESRRLVEELLTIDNLPESVKGMILRKSEGNPFFIEEVIRSLIDRDLVYQEADRWVARAEISDIDVPDTIQSVVMSRVDRLQAEARYVLQCASVIGRLFKYRLLEHLTQQERNLDRHLSEFEARDLVYEERTVPELEYAFKHAFTQEATYQGILEQKRRTFHSQVAQGIERLYQERLEEYYEELAHHYSRSEDAEKAVEYLLKAGEKAKRSCVNEAAIAHFKKTLEVLEGQRVERKDWKLEALRGLGEVYLEMGKTVEAEGAFESAIALAKEMLLSPCQLVRLYYWMASVYFWQSRFDEEIRYGEMGLELLEDNRECLEAALMNARIAIGNANKGNVEKWREYIHNMAFIKKLEYSIELRTPYDIIIHLFTYSGRDLETAWEWSKEWEIRAAQHHDLSGLAFSRWRQGTILTAKGDHKGSLSSFQKSLEMNKRIGREGRIRWCYGHIGKILLHLGNIEEAEKHTRLSLTMDEQAGHLRDIANTHNCLGAIAMCQHLWEEVISHFQNALEGFRAIKNLFKIAEAHLNLGRAYLKKGDCHRARQSFEEIVGKAIETQQNGPLANALWGLEATHLASGTPKAFIDFCCTFRAEHADAIENLSLRQWYLEPVPPSDQFPHLTFTDDFDAGTIAPSWTWMDEFNDCAYRILESGGVEISAANGRDFDGLNTSAPRFMREVSGDFAVEVCLSPASADKPWMGGLLIHQDKDNFLHFEIGVHGENEVRLHGYVGGVQQIVGRGILRATHVSPLQDSEGIVGARHALPNVHLRLERIGDEFSAYCSADGENWFTCGTMTLPLNDPIQLGICAIGMIDRTIYCGAYLDGTATVFRGFKLWCKSGENIVEERRG